MTTTRPMIENTINLFNEVGARDRFKMIVGGGCVTEDWASTIGADGYSADAELCKQFSAEREAPKRVLDKALRAAYSGRG